MRKFLSLIAVLLFCFTAFAQTKNITGKITDQQNQPVPFASVRVKGTKLGVSADADGSFTIKVRAGDVLVITGTGVTAREVAVADVGAVPIQVSRKESSLTEVVVTALGIQRQSKELGYATAKISGKDIEQAKPISIANGLTGKVAGLQINTVNNGLFAPTRIVLRGNRSLTGNNQPLVVVDGAIFYNDINTLNADDIQDVNILKGSSASAIYGSDASNGVIVISTKHGARGRPSITLSTTGQLETVAYLPAYQTRFGNNGGEKYVYDYSDLNDYIPYENQSYGPQFNGALVPSGRPLQDGSLNLIPYSAVKNQKKDFFNKAVTTQNNFTYSAGDDNSRFFLSGQDVNSKNVMPNDAGKRDAFRVGGQKTYGVFSANFSLAYTYKYTNTGNTGSVYEMVMNTPAEIPLSTLKNWQDPKSKFATPDGYFNDYYQNPYMISATQRNLQTDNNLSGNVQLNLKPTKWLSFSYRLAMNNLSRKYEYQQQEVDYSDFSKNDPTVIYSNPTGTGLDTVSEGPKWIAVNSGLTQPAYNTFNYSNFLLTSDFLVNFYKDLSKDFNLRATLGTTYIDNKITEIGVNANNLFVPVFNVNNLTGIPTINGLNYFEEARRLGYFGEATLGYKGFAYVHGSYRTDIDSRLSKENRFIPYYDIDASLVISEIVPAISNSNVLDFLKLHGAYSVTGNASALAGGSATIADGAYATVPTLSPATGYGFPYSGLGGYLLNTSIANPNIEPEQVAEIEAGIQFGFLRDRISLDVTGYRQELTKGIVYAQIPRSSGFTQALVNAASTENLGLEVDLKASIVKARDWSWNIGVNYTYYHSKVKSINGAQQSLAVGGANGNAFAVVGQPYPVIESHDWNRDPANGKVIVNPTTGDPSENSALLVLGNSVPKHILGLTSNLSYKSFALAITMDYRGGYKIFNDIGEYMDFTGTTLTTAITGRQRFVFPNSEYSTDGGKTFVPNTSITTDDANYNFWPGSYDNVGSNYVISAAAWKLREVALTYTLPKSIYAGAKIIQNVAITLSGRNLIMLRPKTNVWTDPEFSEDTGNDVGRTSTSQAPPTRIFSATLAITL